MAKKKKKTFSGEGLLSFLENKNYQKVISKIKQFNIEGMSSEELENITLSSYEALAANNFESGDIVRALRDIDTLISISDTEAYKILKLKYLCYMEYFSEAIIFSQDLIVSKNLKIKKEALFFYLLAKIYHGETTVEEKYLKQIPVSRRYYVLGILEYFKGNAKEAIMHFEKSKPRSKVEKENLKVLQSIILKSDGEIFPQQFIKPLYRFLIFGDIEKLQNTKNSREIKKIILPQFTQESAYENMKDLLSLKRPIPVEQILKEIPDREKSGKLIFNNMVLLIEKKDDYDTALKLFSKYKEQLLTMIESAALLMNIKKNTPHRKNDTFLKGFFNRYLEQHAKKLPSFQLDYIFLFLMQQTDAQYGLNLAKMYGREDFVFLINEIAVIKKFTPEHQASLNRILKRFSLITDNLLKSLSKSIEADYESITDLDERSKRLVVDSFFPLLTLFQNLERPHIKYKESIFEILSNLAYIVQGLDMNQYKKLYLQLSDTVNHLAAYYKMNKVELSIDIKALFVSLGSNRMLRVGRRDIDDLSFEELIYQRMHENREKIYDFDEIEYDLLLIKKDFIDALEAGQDPFQYLRSVKITFKSLYSFTLDLISVSIEYAKKDKFFINNLLKSIGISFRSELLRGRLVAEMHAYAAKDLSMTMYFFKYAIDSIESKYREQVWYFKWLGEYMLMIDDYALEKDSTFDLYLQLFLSTQEKKKFKSLISLEKKIEKRFTRERQGGLFD